MHPISFLSHESAKLPNVAACTFSPFSLNHNLEFLRLFSVNIFDHAGQLKN